MALDNFTYDMQQDNKNKDIMDALSAPQLNKPKNDMYNFLGDRTLLRSGPTAAPNLVNNNYNVTGTKYRENLPSTAGTENNYLGFDQDLPTEAPALQSPAPTIGNSSLSRDVPLNTNLPSVTYNAGKIKEYDENTLRDRNLVDSNLLMKNLGLSGGTGVGSDFELKRKAEELNKEALYNQSKADYALSKMGDIDNQLANLTASARTGNLESIAALKATAPALLQQKKAYSDIASQFNQASQNLFQQSLTGQQSQSSNDLQRAKLATESNIANRELSMKEQKHIKDLKVKGKDAIYDEIRKLMSEGKVEEAKQLGLNTGIIEAPKVGSDKQDKRDVRIIKTTDKQGNQIEKIIDINTGEEVKPKQSAPSLADYTEDFKADTNVPVEQKLSQLRSQGLSERQIKDIAGTEYKPLTARQENVQSIIRTFNNPNNANLGYSDISKILSQYTTSLTPEERNEILSNFTNRPSLGRK